MKRESKFNIKFIKGALPKSGGVYKITFDDNWFYIGSSINIHVRSIQWKGDFKIGDVPFNMKRILPNTSKIKFELIELVFGNKKDILVREDFYIKKYFKHALLLNRCPSAFSNLGIQPLNGYIKKVKECHGIKTLPKKVAQIDTNGEIVHIYNSIAEAERIVCGNRGSHNISDALKGKRIKVYGFKFRIVNNDGSILDFERKRKINKNPNFSKAGRDKFRELILRVNSKKRKPVLMFKDNGDFVKEFVSINELGREMNLSTSNVCKVLKGERKTHNGFVFKYA